MKYNIFYLQYNNSDILFQMQTAPLFFLEIPCKNQLIKIHGLTHKQVILVLENQVRIIFYIHQNSLNSIIYIPWLKIVTDSIYQSQVSMLKQLLFSTWFPDLSIRESTRYFYFPKWSLVPLDFKECCIRYS